MDPNETLRELRKLTNKIRFGLPFDEDRDKLAEYFQALDEWLSRGGPLPNEWSNGLDVNSGRVKR